MMEEMKFIRQLQDNIAEISVGSSALRNQGASGVVAAARAYFKTIKLSEFSSLSSSKFPEWLDKRTEELRNKFPVEAKESWGGARKGLNLFLRSCLYNTYLAREFNLDRKEFILEIPLDKDVATGLYRDAEIRKINLPKWDAIKRLDKKTSDTYQTFAQSLAIEKGVARIHLDLAYWRRKNEHNK
jgi:hypothetical protein